jgi:biotin transport system substrate-specific component
MSKKKISVRELCYISLFTAILAILAQISIPLPLGVPLTLQTFAVALAAIILGSKKGAAAVIVYVLLGAAGAPVFTNFGGGFHRIIGPWGGFILSYPIMAFVIGYAADKNKKIWLALGLPLAALINLSLGTVQFGFVGGVSLAEAFAAAFAPFIAVEAIKMALAFSAGVIIRKVLVKRGFLQ